MYMSYVLFGLTWLASNPLPAKAVDLVVQNDEPSKAKTTSLGEQVEALKKEFAEKKLDLAKRLQDVKDPSERVKLHTREYTELQVSVGDRLMALARKTPKDQASSEALGFVLALGLYKTGHQEAIRLLTENHSESKDVGRCFTNLAFRDAETCLKFARGVAKRNPNRDDRAQAYFTVGSLLKKKLGAVKLDEEEKRVVFEEAKKAFEMVVEKYADASHGPQPIGPMAKGELAGLLNTDRLVIGKEAPDIAGKDLDDKSFKLSDYRGKVILLDFWAHW